jgi:hypothetical protein
METTTPLLASPGTITSAMIQFDGPDSATGRTYFQVCSNPCPDHIGVYVDRFIRLATAWIFAQRRVRIDWRRYFAGSRCATR